MLVRRVRPVSQGGDEASSGSHPIRRELLSAFGSASAEFFPRINITQDGDNLYLHADLPGIDPNQLSISAFRTSVSLAGKRRIVGAHDRQERGDCAFDCTVALPAEVDAERMDAGYCDGALALTLPKA